MFKGLTARKRPLSFPKHPTFTNQDHMPTTHILHMIPQVLQNTNLTRTAKELQMIRLV
jgi:hypothetical protein